MIIATSPKLIPPSRRKKHYGNRVRFAICSKKLGHYFDIPPNRPIYLVIRDRPTKESIHAIFDHGYVQVNNGRRYPLFSSASIWGRKQGLHGKEFHVSVEYV